MPMNGLLFQLRTNHAIAMGSRSLILRLGGEGFSLTAIASAVGTSPYEVRLMLAETQYEARRRGKRQAQTDLDLRGKEV